MTDQTEREKFEAYYGERGWPMARIDNPSGYIEYIDQRTHRIWMGWQSRAELDTHDEARDLALIKFVCEEWQKWDRHWVKNRTPKDHLAAFLAAQKDKRDE